MVHSRVRRDAPPSKGEIMIIALLVLIVLLLAFPGLFRVLGWAILVAVLIVMVRMP